MLKDQVHVGMKVMFGSVNGSKTLGVVEKVNPSRAKIKAFDSSWSVWMVPYSLIYPIDGDIEKPGLTQPVSMVHQRVEGLVNRYGLAEVIAALKKITGKSEL